jgi:tetratricopeptide (TPR) repeat protein
MRLEDLACLLDDGDVASARPWFERPSEGLEAPGRFWLLRGNWLGMQGSHEEALKSYREAVRRDPKAPEARYRLSQALHTAGLGHEADEVLVDHQRLQQLSLLAAQISETSPDSGLLLQAARLCHVLGRDREARAWYAAVLRIAPSHAEARQFLAGPSPRGGGPRSGH